MHLDAATLATEAWLAIANQPRARCLINIHSLLEDEWDRCNIIHNLIYLEARGRKLKGAHDVEAWAYICAKREMNGGSWRKVVEIARAAAVANEAHMTAIKSRAS